MRKRQSRIAQLKFLKPLQTPERNANIMFLKDLFQRLTSPRQSPDRQKRRHQPLNSLAGSVESWPMIDSGNLQEKNGSLREFAKQIAHDLNNLNTGIISNVQLMLNAEARSSADA